MGGSETHHLEDPTLSFATWKPNWPAEFPIFSPYAATKGENHTSQYSQVRFSGDGRKYYCHQAAFVQLQGKMSLFTWRSNKESQAQLEVNREMIKKKYSQ
jgi:hypothetical protein